MGIDFNTILYHISPTYDLLSTRLVIPEKDDPEELALTMNGRKRKFTRTDFMQFAQKLNLKEKQVENVGPLLDVQSTGNFASRMHARLANDRARMLVATAFDLIRNVLHFKQMRLRAKIGDIGATTRNAFNVTFVVQLPQCAVCRHAGDVHRLDEVVLRRHAIAWCQFTG